ncbi:MAG: hypothetical protein QOJ29_49 [Thermoleophilaceae bacterium]|jgi:hypothetical protein|nr:hypothetical protein [Thermoleophilaceae bacterium]
MSPSRTDFSPSRTKASRRTLSEAMTPTTRALAAAHDAGLNRAIDGFRWERRGLLGRLTRMDGS